MSRTRRVADRTGRWPPQVGRGRSRPTVPFLPSLPTRSHSSFALPRLPYDGARRVSALSGSPMVGAISQRPYGRRAPTLAGTNARRHRASELDFVQVRVLREDKRLGDGNGAGPR